MLDPRDSRYLTLLKKTLTASLYDESGWQPVFKQVPGKLSVRYGVRMLGSHTLHQLLAKQKWSLLERKPLDHDKRNDGMDWPLFGYTMVGHKRLDNIQDCIIDVVRNNVPGDVVETGVWRGGSIILMRAVLQVLGVTDRRVWACDSFEGLPVPQGESDGFDLSEFDYIKVSLEQVKDNLARFDLLDDQVMFLKGWFADTLPSAPIDRISVLRLDGDLYSSTMDALQALYHRVSPGGYVIIDDYGTWDSCKRAVTDFLRDRGEHVQIHKIDESGVYWKISG